MASKYRAYDNVDRIRAGMAANLRAYHTACHMLEDAVCAGLVSPYAALAKLKRLQAAKKYRDDLIVFPNLNTLKEAA